MMLQCEDRWQENSKKMHTKSPMVLLYAQTAFSKTSSAYRTW